MLRFAKDRQRWLQWLFEAKERYGLVILNYMATSNHIQRPSGAIMSIKNRQRNYKMKTKKLFFTFVMWAAFAGLVNPGAALADQEEKPKNPTILQKWSGDYPVSELRRLPENLRAS